MKYRITLDIKNPLESEDYDCAKAYLDSLEKEHDNED
jgi:hypothetical protein